MLLADQRRPQQVVDAAIEDDDRRAIDRLAVDDARQVRAGRPDEEAPRLEQEPRLGEERVVGPAGDDRARGRDRTGRGRATPRAPRTGCRGRRRRRRAGRSCRPARRAAGRPGPWTRRGRRARPHRGRSRRRSSGARGARGAATARPAAPTRRGPRHPSRTCPRRRRRRGGHVRAGRPRSSAARSMTGTRRPASAAIASSRPSSPGDSTVTARMPASTAARSSSSRLPGPVMTMRDGRMPARSAVASSPAEATSAPAPEPAEVGDDGQGRVGLDRVGEIDDRRQDGAQRRDLAVDDVEVVDVQRRPEAGRQLLRGQAAETAGPEDLVAGRRPAATRRSMATPGGEPPPTDGGVRVRLIAGRPRGRPVPRSRRRGP